MNEAAVYLVSFSVLTFVAQVLLWLVMRAQHKRLQTLERSFLAHLKTYLSFVDVVGKTAASQQQLNGSIYDLINLHHVALGLSTGVSEEIAKFLKENDNG